MEEQLLLEGNISVKAALLAKKRKVIEVLADETKQDKDTRFILAKAHEAGVLVRKTTREEIDALAQGKTHGGLVARVGERTYATLAEVLDEDRPFLALVEGVEDPFNFGYLCRTLYAAGCDGLLVNERNWSSAAKVVTKASAGASEYLRIVPIRDFDAALKQLKAKQIRLYCAMREEAIEYYDADLTVGMCIAIGGEMRGLSKTVLAHSDQNIYIPYQNDFRNALNATGAAAAIAFECLRQRRQ